MIHTKFLLSSNHKVVWTGSAPVLTKGMKVKIEANIKWDTVEEMMQVWESYVSIAGSNVPHQTVYLEKAVW